jgi:hypothetical protein
MNDRRLVVVGGAVGCKVGFFISLLPQKNLRLLAPRWRNAAR